MILEKSRLVLESLVSSRVLDGTTAEQAYSIIDNGGVVGLADPFLTVETVQRTENCDGLIVLAVKTSSGGLRRRPYRYYLEEYPCVKREVASRIARDVFHSFPSVLEHCYASFLVEGCSRVCTHQLVRHRIASYTQESLRFVAPDPAEELELVSDAISTLENVRRMRTSLRAEHFEDVLEFVWERFVLPPFLNDGEEAFKYTKMILENYRNYLVLLADGLKREEARRLLPISVRSRILITANLRSWKHIITMRTDPRAQPEIRLVARIIDTILGRRYSWWEESQPLSLSP